MVRQFKLIIERRFRILDTSKVNIILISNHLYTPTLVTNNNNGPTSGPTDGHADYVKKRGRIEIAMDVENDELINNLKRCETRTKAKNSGYKDELMMTLV